MLSGKELGRAIELAIQRKISSGAIKTKVEIARHFKVKPPSIHDWIKKGSISKDKLPELWNYFSDVVGPEHWGLSEFPSNASAKLVSEPSPESHALQHSYALASDERKAVVDYLLTSGSDIPSWVDSDVRAYTITMDAKAREWLNNNRTPAKNRKQSKTGS
ncbi:hypothetical protein WCT79_04415 [Pectobacterium carotovorum]|uniref:DNA-binding transcriptional repressor RacR n=1 Tax=Pectobacterium carotovorum TaxID=554 RepID=UPI0030185D88